MKLLRRNDKIGITLASNMYRLVRKILKIRNNLLPNVDCVQLDTR